MGWEVTVPKKYTLVEDRGLSAHLDVCAVQAGGSLAAADLLSAGPPLIQQLTPKLIFWGEEKEHGFRTQSQPSTPSAASTGGENAVFIPSLLSLMATQILPEDVHALSRTPEWHAKAKSPNHEEFVCAPSAYPEHHNAAQLGPHLENTVLTASVTGGLGKAAASTGPGASRRLWQLANGFSLTPSSFSRDKVNIYSFTKIFMCIAVDGTP